MQDFFVMPIPRRGRVLQTQTKKSHLKVNFQMRFPVLFCDPCRIQTCNPHIRSVVLYSVELTDHCFFSKASAKVLLFFDMTKYFEKKCVKRIKNSHFSCVYANFVVPLQPIFDYSLWRSA